MTMTELAIRADLCRFHGSGTHSCQFIDSDTHLLKDSCQINGSGAHSRQFDGSGIMLCLYYMRCVKPSPRCETFGPTYEIISCFIQSSAETRGWSLGGGPRVCPEVPNCSLPCQLSPPDHCRLTPLVPCLPKRPPPLPWGPTPACGPSVRSWAGAPGREDRDPPAARFASRERRLARKAPNPPPRLLRRWGSWLCESCPLRAPIVARRLHA